MRRSRIIHTLEPIVDRNSRVLVLGTMPSPASREIGFYYGHPQNRFWKVLSALFDRPLPQTNEERRRLVLEERMALWDVLASCDIDGAADASIANPIPNDLQSVLERAPIQAICTTGSKAAQLYRAFNPELAGRIPHIALPSTSAANARMRLDDLVEAYRPILEYVR